MKFKVFKVTPDATKAGGEASKQTLEYQLEVKDADTAVDFILKTVPHRVCQVGLSLVPAADGVHLTKYAVLDATDIWWVIPVWRFVKKPEPISS